MLSFLSQMDVVVPWPELVALLQPHYPDTGKGRPPVGIERMLRIYFLQAWFNSSDREVEDALYESPSMRGLLSIDLGREPAPDETTVCKFRHLLERHGLGKRLFAEVNCYPCRFRRLPVHQPQGVRLIDLAEIPAFPLDLAL